jgi:hypothetical protein
MISCFCMVTKTADALARLENRVPGRKSMSEWSFEDSVDAAVPLDAAWTYWTDVSNRTLDSDIESEELAFVENRTGHIHRGNLRKDEHRNHLV